jgi:transposase
VRRGETNRAGSLWASRTTSELRQGALQAVAHRCSARHPANHSVWDFVHAATLSFKKTVQASEQDRPDVARRRAQWTARQSGIEPTRLVFIDETWTKTNMTPLRGWGLRGLRLRAKAPHGRWKTMTFLAALRFDRIDAPWLLDGPINGEKFHLYVDKLLVPTLEPGDIVVMDNLGSHKGWAVRRAIRSAGAKLFFLPKYSPDLNPIEQVFAKLKHLLRKAAARSFDAIAAAIEQLLDSFSPEEWANYFANSRYKQT